MKIIKQIIITELQTQFEDEPGQHVTQTEPKDAGKDFNELRREAAERATNALTEDAPERLKVSTDDTVGMKLKSDAAKQAVLEQQRTRLARKRIVEAERKERREAEEPEARIQVDMSTLDLGLDDDDLLAGMQLA